MARYLLVESKSGSMYAGRLKKKKKNKISPGVKLTMLRQVYTAGLLLSTLVQDSRTSTNILNDILYFSTKGALSLGVGCFGRSLLANTLYSMSDLIASLLKRIPFAANLSKQRTF